MKLLPARCRPFLGVCRPAPLLVLAGLVWLLGATGCADEVNLTAVPEAVLGCEEPTADELEPEAPMLPGRRCISCHKSGAQASRRAWTVAGTVFAAQSADDSKLVKCNSQGLQGVQVLIAEPVTRRVLVTMYTNRSGNFFSAEPIDTSSIIAYISKDGKHREMQIPVNTGDCGLCHSPTGAAAGRIYLNLN